MRAQHKGKFLLCLFSFSDRPPTHDARDTETSTAAAEEKHEENELLCTFREHNGCFGTADHSVRVIEDRCQGTRSFHCPRHRHAL